MPNEDYGIAGLIVAWLIICLIAGGIGVAAINHFFG